MQLSEKIVLISKSPECIRSIWNPDTGVDTHKTMLFVWIEMRIESELGD